MWQGAEQAGCDRRRVSGMLTCPEGLRRMKVDGYLCPPCPRGKRNRFRRHHRTLRVVVTMADGHPPLARQRPGGVSNGTTLRWMREHNERH